MVPYKINGWGAPLIVNKTIGQLYTDSSFTPNDVLYIGYAYTNIGTATTPNTTIQTNIYVDNVLTLTRYYQGTVTPNDQIYANDKSIGQLSAGAHTIKMVVDATNVINESNESNNEYSVTINVSAPNIQTTSVNLNKSSTSLVTGMTDQLVATVSPSNAANQTLTWSSSNPSIATVNSNGLVTGVAAGTTNVIATASNGIASSPCTVIVTESSSSATETLTVSNPTTTGFTVTFAPRMAGLTVSNFLLLDSSSKTVTITGATTTDNGATYRISAALSAGKTYIVTAADSYINLISGNTFATAQSVVVPTSSSGSGNYYVISTHTVYTAADLNANPSLKSVLRAVIQNNPNDLLINFQGRILSYAAANTLIGQLITSNETIAQIANALLSTSTIQSSVDISTYTDPATTSWVTTPTYVGFGQIAGRS